MTSNASNRRHMIYWRTLAHALHQTDHTKSADKIVRTLNQDANLPAMLLDPRFTIQATIRRHPELESTFESLIPDEETPIDEESVHRALIYSKMLVNVFGQAPSGNVSAGQYNDWLQDVGHFRAALGQASGGGEEGGEGTSTRTLYDETENMEMDDGYEWNAPGSGGAPEVKHEDVEYALEEIKRGRSSMSRPQIEASLKRTEQNLIQRMALREVLKDPKLVAKIQPSMAMTEQLLRDKNNLEGPALKHAKMLIQRYVKELADIIKREVQSTSKGKVDNNVPPKRTFSNLDLKKTIWKNLTNWDPNEERLYVDRLFYKRNAKRTNDKTRLIVVVDQSGSMIPAMINCTILASIFASLPKVDAHLIAFDTRVIDLTPWVNDPFEVLLRTKLGGGNDGPVAMRYAASKIIDPRNTVMVWISDFYEYRSLFPMCRAVHQAGTTFIPVGSVSSSGYFSVDSWFRQQFKTMGTPVLSGSLKTLIRELKSVLPG